jgi:TM2 domain-containing membrane protein YozV
MPFRSMNERLMFGEHLYCNGDYLRAVDEFLFCGNSDSVKARIAFCYLKLDSLPAADRVVNSIGDDTLRDLLLTHTLFTLVRGKEYGRLAHSSDGGRARGTDTREQFLRLAAYAKFMLNECLDCSDGDAFLFSPGVNDTIAAYNLERAALKYKNPLLAVGLSALVPGLGKIYTGDVSDGVTGFLITGLLGYATWQNIENGHALRAAMTGAAAAFFYGGAVYGSYVSAHMHNARLFANLTLRFDAFFAGNNYFITAPELIRCR